MAERPIWELTGTQQRAIILAACRFAVQKTGLTDPAIDAGITALEHGQYGDGPIREAVKAVACSSRSNSKEALAATAVDHALDPSPSVGTRSIDLALKATQDEKGLRLAVYGALLEATEPEDREELLSQLRANSQRTSEVPT